MIYASFVLQLARVNNRDFRLWCPGARSLSLNVFDNIFALQKSLKGVNESQHDSNLHSVFPVKND